MEIAIEYLAQGVFYLGAAQCVGVEADFVVHFCAHGTSHVNLGSRRRDDVY